MTEASPVDTDTDGSAGDVGGQRASIQQLAEVLDGWRARIDELMVQLDLVDLDIRDEVRKQLGTAQNVYLAARSQLSKAEGDAETNLSSVRLGLEQLIQDLRDAYGAAEAVVRRARQQ